MKKVFLFLLFAAITTLFVSCEDNEDNKGISQLQKEIQECRDSLNAYKSLYGNLKDNLRVKLTFKDAVITHFHLKDEKHYYQALVSEGPGKPEFRVAIIKDLPIDTSMTYIVRKGVIIDDWGIPVVREAGK
jgi:hypothetical protein